MICMGVGSMGAGMALAFDDEANPFVTGGGESFVRRHTGTAICMAAYSQLCSSTQSSVWQHTVSCMVMQTHLYDSAQPFVW